MEDLGKIIGTILVWTLIIWVFTGFGSPSKEVLHCMDLINDANVKISSLNNQIENAQSNSRYTDYEVAYLSLMNLQTSDYIFNDCGK